MPSVTVLVSSDTDIYISPGLYGDCLPTWSTVGAADSFRAEHRSLRSACLFGCHFMLAHTRGSEQRPPPPGTAAGIHVTWTLSPSSK
ncbi:hypothetical protein ELQ87_28525 [Streptomyces griseoviridis]|uniref:Uncharacterized protein n=1 Tax=Streptomyces griseoviridis TaxID=45398 RepID=A0A3S9ZJB0_STRGD|nr:hypothetical protein ELQ87_28525 [Streptomyces griseoviridis]